MALLRYDNYSWTISKTTLFIFLVVGCRATNADLPTILNYAGGCSTSFQYPDHRENIHERLQFVERMHPKNDNCFDYQPAEILATNQFVGSQVDTRKTTSYDIKRNDQTVLEPIIIRGRASSYVAPNAGTATRTDTPIMETPFSVKVVPGQVFRDQQAVRLDQALQNVSGINREVSNAGLADGITLRGFQVIPFRDGFRFEDQNSNGRRDMANIERVEVLKGPGSILYGQAEPGGIINMVTKKPLATPFHKLEQQFGSFDFYRTTLDSTGPLGAGLGYRVNLAYENAGSFRDFVHGERIFVAPVLRWDLSPRTQIDLSVDYLHGQNTPDNGIPADGNRPLDVPRERFFGEPFNQAKYDDIVVGLNWRHAFNDQWQIRHRFSAEILRSEVTNVTTPFSGTILSDDLRSVRRQLEVLRNARNESYYTTVDLTGHFETWGIKHRVLFGGDYYREDTRWGFVEEGGDALEFDALGIANPVYQTGGPPPINAARDFPGDDIDETEEWFGLFAQNQMELPYDVHVLAGFRYDRVWAREFERSESTGDPPDDALTPRAGLLWRPVPALAFYGSYTENFSGANGLARQGGKLPPESAQQWEVGVKSELLNGKLLATFAYYDLAKQNVAVPDPVNPFFSRTVGELAVRGFEFDIQGELLPGWRVIGAYAYTPFAKIIQDQAIIQDDEDNVIGTNPGNTGKRFDDVPRHNVSLWSTYEVQKGMLQGLKLGAGVIAVSQRQANLDNTAQAPGYAIVNLMAGYTYKLNKMTLRFQLNAENIFDRHYFVSTNGLRFMPGVPRSILGSVSIVF
jgi:iron complex outermembrane recepter protein